MSKYRVFKRTWWKNNPEWPNGLEPHAGKKTTLSIVDSEQAARDYCEVWNKNHDPGRLSLKAEYEQL